MTDNTSLVNLALQSFGSRTTITAAQLATNGNNEAKQANLTFANTRDSLLRLAPWDCAMKTVNLTFITSVPGTPENTGPATQLWQPGQPRPPWAYEYQYPVDCLRACWIIPAAQTGFAGGIPITTAVTGSAPTTWLGPAIPFKIGVDQFFSVKSFGVQTGGSGYAVGDVVTMSTLSTYDYPIGAPFQFIVTAVDGAGAIVSGTVINQVIDANPIAGGSYFFNTDDINPNDVGVNTGAGVGGTMVANYNAKSDQRVIYTNQQNATLVHVRQVTDPNVWDPMFQDAFVQALGGDICYALTGDKTLAKLCYAKANDLIVEARKADSNEGLTVNDVTPDWIRARGIAFDDVRFGGQAFDWGGYYGSV